MKIAIGGDHAGFPLKATIIDAVKALGHEVTDHGCHDETPVDFPDITREVCAAVTAGKADRAILVCGTGVGASIAANKVPGIRAALCNDLYTARLSREHNDANVLSMGGRIVGAGLADEILTLWLTTGFEGGRHQRRIDQISAAEQR